MRAVDETFIWALFHRPPLPASRIQAMSTENKTRFHLPDGPEQEARDARMASGSTDFAIRAVEWIYAHDASRIDTPAPV